MFTVSKHKEESIRIYKGFNICAYKGKQSNKKKIYQNNRKHYLSIRPKITKTVCFRLPILKFLSIFRGFPRDLPVRPYGFPVFPM